MSKKVDELLPSDKVMIEFGAKTQKNADTGELVTIEKAKTLDLPYGFFLSAMEDRDGYNEGTGYVKAMGRTMKVLGLAVYEDQMTDNGEMIKVPTVGGFDTDASRAQALKVAQDQQAALEQAVIEREAKVLAAAKEKEEAETKARDAKLKADAEKKTADDAKTQAAADAEARVEQKAKDDFEADQKLDAEAEQNKRKVAADAEKKAANKPA